MFQYGQLWSKFNLFPSSNGRKLFLYHPFRKDNSLSSNQPTKGKDSFIFIFFLYSYIPSNQRFEGTFKVTIEIEDLLFGKALFPIPKPSFISFFFR